MTNHRVAVNQVQYLRLQKALGTQEKSAFVENNVILSSESIGKSTSLNRLNELLHKLILRITISKNMHPGRIRN